MAIIQSNKSNLRKKHIRLSKLEKHNLKQKFIRDFGSGKVSIAELSRKYQIDRRILLDFKKEIYGLGSLKQKRMYQMYLAEIPSNAIAEFFGVSVVFVHKNIRIQKELAIKNQE